MSHPHACRGHDKTVLDARWWAGSAKINPSHGHKKLSPLGTELLAWREDALCLQELLYNCMYELFRDVDTLGSMYQSFVQQASKVGKDRSPGLEQRVNRKMTEVSRKARDLYQCPDGAPAPSVAALYLLCVVKQQFNTLVGGVRDLENEREGLAKVCVVHVRSCKGLEDFVHNGRAWDDLQAQDLHPERKVDVQGLGGFLQMMDAEELTHTSQVVHIGDRVHPYSDCVREDGVLALSQGETSVMPNSGVIMDCHRRIERLQEALLSMLGRVVVV